jgi:hypothetical protein
MNTSVGIKDGEYNQESIVQLRNLKRSIFPEKPLCRPVVGKRDKTDKMKSRFDDRSINAFLGLCGIECSHHACFQIFHWPFSETNEFSILSAKS